MFDSFTSPASVGWDIIRLLFSTLDRPAYALLSVIYELFFNVASADLFSNQMIMMFYKRVQIILGVYMMFTLAMTILRGIVNPDNFEKDSNSLVTKIITALVIFVLLMPISTGGGNEFEKQVNNNGLLFGTLYSLQHRILANNTIGRLVLGTNDSDITFGDTAVAGDTELKKSARIFTSTILKGFYRINLVPEDQRVNRNDGKDPAIYNENRVCKDIDDGILDAYKKVDAEPGEILDLVTATCDSDAAPSFLNGLRTGFQKLTGGTKYIFTYTPLISTITAIVFIFILLSFTIDVAVRAVKLAVLRLIAPIPIISYMNPQAGKDSAFNAWVKTLTSTYLDLFIRLASVYFVIFLIQDMIVNGVSISTTAGNGFLHVLSCIIIWIGLFIFAKQAPKFIKQVLGLKEDPGKLFGGFGEIGAAMGMLTSVPGAIGSARAGYRASKMADETREAFGEKDIFGRTVNPNSGFNRAKHIVAGITGGVAGGVAGASAAYNAKDHGFKASMEAMRKRNADALARGNNGSTLFGRLQSTASNVFAGEGSADAISRQMETNKGRIEALKGVKGRVTSEMVKSDYTTGNLGVTGSDGRQARANYKDFMSRLEAARSQGLHSFNYINTTTGREESIDIQVAEKQKGFLLKNNEDNYIKRTMGTYVPTAAEVAAGDNVSNYRIQAAAGEKQDARLVTLLHSAEVLGGSSNFTRNADGSIDKGDNKPIVGRSDINDAIDGFEDYNTQLGRANAINKANDSYSGGKK